MQSTGKAQLPLKMQSTRDSSIVFTSQSGVGDGEGADVGFRVGDAVGLDVGLNVGALVGLDVGRGVGDGPSMSISCDHEGES